MKSTQEILLAVLEGVAMRSDELVFCVDLAPNRCVGVKMLVTSKRGF